MKAKILLAQRPMIGNENQGYVVIGLVNLTTHDIGSELSKSEVTVLCKDRRLTVEICEWSKT